MRLSFMLRKLCFTTVALTLGCTAQAPDLELNRRIERHIRAEFSIPANVQVAIGERKPSEFPNYEKVSVTLASGERKQAHEFLLSKDGKEMLRLTRFDISTDPYAEVMKKIDLRGRPIRGNKDAKVTIVNYDDFQCPFCARIHQTLTNDVLKTYGDRVKIIYKDFPLFEIHPWAGRAANNANCLAEHSSAAYWEYVDYAHMNQAEIGGNKRPKEEQFAHLDKVAQETGKKHNVDALRLQACIRSQKEAVMRASVKEGQELNVSSTPTLFVNGEKVEGAVPLQELRAIIDRALRDSGQPVSESAQDSSVGTTKPQ
jgi:protein-disulfide isomerase